MACAQKSRFRLSAKRTSPFKSAGGRQFSRLLAAVVCASAVVMLDTPCFEVVWRVLATHYIHQFPLHFPSRASPCAITFQLDYNLMQSKSVGKRPRNRCIFKVCFCCITALESVHIWDRQLRIRVTFVGSMDVFKFRECSQFAVCLFPFLCNTCSFLTWSVQRIFSILLQHHISKLSRRFWSVARSSICWGS